MDASFWWNKIALCVVQNEPVDWASSSRRKREEKKILTLNLLDERPYENVKNQKEQNKNDTIRNEKKSLF